MIKLASSLYHPINADCCDSLAGGRAGSAVGCFPGLAAGEVQARELHIALCTDRGRPGGAAGRCNHRLCRLGGKLVPSYLDSHPEYRVPA